MNEAETRAELIDPKLKAAGWGVIEGSKILHESNVCALVDVQSLLSPERASYHNDGRSPSYKTSSFTSPERV